LPEATYSGSYAEKDEGKQAAATAMQARSGPGRTKIVFSRSEMDR